jgi:hypothetical protein
VLSVARGGIGEIANLFINLDQDLDPSLNLCVTGHHLSLPPENLVVHVGLSGHLPSLIGLGDTGIGGNGASIVNAAPIGF